MKSSHGGPVATGCRAGGHRSAIGKTATEDDLRALIALLVGMSTLMFSRDRIGGGPTRSDAARGTAGSSPERNFGIFTAITRPRLPQPLAVAVRLFCRSGLRSP